jgi:hypothetical protein
VLCEVQAGTEKRPSAKQRNITPTMAQPFCRT